MKAVKEPSKINIDGPYLGELNTSFEGIVYISFLKHFKVGP